MMGGVRNLGTEKSAKNTDIRRKKLHIYNAL